MCTAGGRVRFAHIFCIESHPSHREPLRFPPKPKLRSTYQRVLPSAWTQKWYMYIASSRRGREQKMEVQVQQNSGHRGMLQDTNTHQKHPHCSMWKPRIPLHQYLDTEYVSILNSPPALCSVNGITKLCSSYHTMVVQINTIKLKSMLFFMLIIPTQK